MDLLSASTVPEVRPPARVFIQTLGDFKVIVGGNAVTYEGGGVGREQLRAMLAYSVFKVEHTLLLSDLRSIARACSPKERAPQRPNYVINGFCAMLRSWGMDEAFQRGETVFSLQRTPCWTSDVDAIDAAYHKAVRCEQAGDLPQAIALLSDVVPLCNGDYLKEFTFAHESSFAEQVNYWNSVQRQTLIRLAALYLRHSPGLCCDQAYTVARRAIELGGCGADAYDTAAAAAECCGHRELADHYRYIALRRRGPKR